MQVGRIASLATANSMGSQQQNVAKNNNPAFGSIKLDESKKPLQSYINMFVENDKDATGFISSIFNRMFAQGGALDKLTGATVVKIKPFITRDAGENLLNFRISSGSKKHRTETVETLCWDNFMHEYSTKTNEAEGIIRRAVKRILN